MGFEPIVLSFFVIYMSGETNTRLILLAWTMVTTIESESVFLVVKMEALNGINL